MLSQHGLQHVLAQPVLVQHALYIIARPDFQFLCCTRVNFLVYSLWPKVHSHSAWWQSCACNWSMFCTCTRSGSPHNVMHSSSIICLQIESSLSCLPHVCISHLHARRASNGSYCVGNFTSICSPRSALTTVYHSFLCFWDSTTVLHEDFFGKTYPNSLFACKVRGYLLWEHSCSYISTTAALFFSEMQAKTLCVALQ